MPPAHRGGPAYLGLSEDEPALTWPPPRAATRGGAGRGALALVVMVAAVAGWLKGAPLLDGMLSGVQGEVVVPSTLGYAGVARLPEGGPSRRGRAPGDAAGAVGAGGSDPPAAPAEQSEAVAGDGAAQATRDVPRQDESPSGPSSSSKPAGIRIYTHQVQPGETLWDIAQRYGTDVDTVASANGLYDLDYLKPGQVLDVPNVRGVVHTVGRGETLSQIARSYGVSVDRIVRGNAIVDPDHLTPGMRIVIPGASSRTVDRLVVAGRLQRAFSWPARGGISSPFGWRWGRMHEGIDIAVNTGTPVRAAAPGRVVYARWGGSYGYLVSVDHGDGVETRYAHNSRIVVREGQAVRRGQVLAYSGNTGNSTGPHVHFEVRFRGRAVNPLAYLR
ncbi:M23 family metallopeptidase [Carboxydochorda subterranea]|uniref:M23 family metallopeptidase n=1 Tax=Carboxydichorda subterranea TaxID=3109565 RepID=A0ABZ1BX43_9FIRM|nr:M23 family metallopeptidase [Limnochorda sp. L945t]WRP16702.1 M23 family metallopeptidase [Limnochorda sp. L945t]